MKTTARTPHDTPDSSPSVVTIASAALIIGILVAGAIAFAINHTSDPHPTAPPSPSPTPTVLAPPDTAAPVEGFAVPEVDIFGRRVDIPANPEGVIRAQTAARRHPGDPEWLTAAPAGLREPGGWQRVHGAVVPFSTSDGPTRIDNGVAAGYAHTPQGAALAAAMSVHQVAARPGNRAVLAQRLLLSTADQARFDAGITAGRYPAQQPPQVTRALLAFDAFRIDRYDDDLAVVQLAARADDPEQGRRWITARVPMVWHAGDWRLRGSTSQLSTDLVTNLTGWTLWC